MSDFIRLTQVTDTGEERVILVNKEIIAMIQPSWDGHNSVVEFFNREKIIVVGDMDYMNIQVR